MSKKKRDFYYIMPGSRKAAVKCRLRNRIAAVVVGVVAAGSLGWLLFFHYGRM